jgi:hypothetical protein
MRKPLNISSIFKKAEKIPILAPLSRYTPTSSGNLGEI